METADDVQVFHLFTNCEIHSVSKKVLEPTSTLPKRVRITPFTFQDNGADARVGGRSFNFDSNGTEPKVKIVVTKSNSSGESTRTTSDRTDSSAGASVELSREFCIQIQSGVWVTPNCEETVRLQIQQREERKQKRNSKTLEIKQENDQKLEEEKEKKISEKREQRASVDITISRLLYSNFPSKEEFEKKQREKEEEEIEKKQREKEKGDRLQMTELLRQHVKNYCLTERELRTDAMWVQMKESRKTLVTMGHDLQPLYEQVKHSRAYFKAAKADSVLKASRKQNAPY